MTGGLRAFDYIDSARNRTPGERWEPVFACGPVHVDVNAADRRNLQLVIRDDGLLAELYRAGMVHLTYGQREFLLRGYHAELRQQTPTATMPDPLPGVFYPWDFRKMIAEDWAGTAYEVERQGGRLVLKLLSFRHGYSRHGYPDQQTYHRTYQFERAAVLCP